MTAIPSAGDQVAKERQAPIEEVMGAVFRLQTALDTLAALGARLGSPPGAIPGEVAAAMDEVLTAAGISGIDHLAPEQRAMVAAAARSVFGQAADILNRPERLPGWTHTDVEVLEGQGRASMVVPGHIAQRGGFQDVKAFLDVGTGVGWLAVAAARMWPNATIVGVDTWEPALERARANVAGAGLAERVELRKQDVTELDDTDRFDLTWVPSFFIRPDVLPTAFTRILTATGRRGSIVVGHFDPPPDPLAWATQKLRTLRDGGALAGEDELINLLTDAGWAEVRALPRPGPLPLGLVAGRKA
jgi:protein-L-isoaspartate O-methyltransferase